MPPRKKPPEAKDPTESLSVEDIKDLSPLEQALALSRPRLQKKFGDLGAVREELKNLSQPILEVSDLGRQWALKATGYRGGRFIVLAADPGASKSSLALDLCEQARQQGGLAEYIDMEDALNEDHLSYYISDPAEFTRHVHTPYTLEDGIETMRELNRVFGKVDPERKLAKIIVFDAIGGAASKHELDPDKEIAQMKVGAASSYLTVAARVLEREFATTGTIGVWVNHAKEKIFTGYEALVPRKAEDKLSYPGGKGPIYASSYLEHLKRGGDVKDSEKMRKGFSVLPVFYRNRGRPNGRSYGYDIIYEVGPGESILYTPHTMEFLAMGQYLGMSVKAKRYWCPEIGVKETDKLNDQDMYDLIHQTPRIKARFQLDLRITTDPNAPDSGDETEAEM